MNFKKISNQTLLETTQKLVLEERKLNLDILHNLKEIELRKLHLELGFSSLFEYTVQSLGYSEDAAYRRISAMRLIKSLPQIEEKIASGSLSLTSACKIQSFFRQEEKQSKAAQVKSKLSTPDQKLTWIKSLENKSTRDVEKEILKLNPMAIPQEKVRTLSEDKTEIKIIIDEELKTQLDQLKHLLSHRLISQINPNITYQELIKYLVKMGLDKLDPARKTAKSLGAPKVETQTPLKKKISRYIPSTIKHEVYLRDKGCCSFRTQKTHQKCNSKHLLQYDHIQPMAFGGETTPNNLRLLCANHHKLVTERVFGHKANEL
jgi:hypothetical protein